MTTEIPVIYGSEKVKTSQTIHPLGGGGGDIVVHSNERVLMAYWLGELQENCFILGKKILIVLKKKSFFRFAHCYWKRNELSLNH